LVAWERRLAVNRGRRANPAAFDPLFTEALAARFAAEIAVSLTESLGKAQALW
jgi:hypothetical protein